MVWARRLNSSWRWDTGNGVQKPHGWSHVGHQSGVTSKRGDRFQAFSKRKVVKSHGKQQAKWKNNESNAPKFSRVLPKRAVRNATTRIRDSFCLLERNERHPDVASIFQDYQSQMSVV